MRTFSAGLLLIFTATAWAEPRTANKPVVCDATVKVLTTIVEEFEETPQWRGVNPLQNTQIMLTVNAKTGAWTLIEYNNITACVIGVGENSSSRWGISI